MANGWHPKKHNGLNGLGCPVGRKWMDPWLVNQWVYKPTYRWDLLGGLTQLLAVFFWVSGISTPKINGWKVQL